MSLYSFGVELPGMCRRQVAFRVIICESAHIFADVYSVLGGRTAIFRFINICEGYR